MGYRSTFISQDLGGKLPEWFAEKYKEDLNVASTVISTILERKLYFGGYDFFYDYQKALIEAGRFSDGCEDRKVYIVCLSEGGSITRVTISKDDIEFHLMDKGPKMMGPAIDLYLDNEGNNTGDFMAC